MGTVWEVQKAEMTGQRRRDSAESEERRGSCSPSKFPQSPFKTSPQSQGFWVAAEKGSQTLGFWPTCNPFFGKAEFLKWGSAGWAPPLTCSRRVSVCAGVPILYMLLPLPPPPRPNPESFLPPLRQLLPHDLLAPR